MSADLDADPRRRLPAVDRLLALLAAEKQRGAQESLGNMIQIYEALGDTGDARAIAPLERELLDASVPTAPKVVIVQSLVALRAVDARKDQSYVLYMLGQPEVSVVRLPVGEYRKDEIRNIARYIKRLSKGPGS